MNNFSSIPIKYYLLFCSCIYCLSSFGRAPIIDSTKVGDRVFFTIQAQYVSSHPESASFHAFEQIECLGYDFQRYLSMDVSLTHKLIFNANHLLGIWGLGTGVGLSVLDHPRLNWQLRAGIRYGVDFDELEPYTSYGAGTRFTFHRLRNLFVEAGFRKYSIHPDLFHTYYLGLGIKFGGKYDYYR